MAKWYPRNAYMNKIIELLMNKSPIPSYLLKEIFIYEIRKRRFEEKLKHIK